MQRVTAVPRTLKKAGKPPQYMRAVLSSVPSELNTGGIYDNSDTAQGPDLPMGGDEVYIEIPSGLTKSTEHPSIYQVLCIMDYILYTIYYGLNILYVNYYIRLIQAYFGKKPKPRARRPRVSPSLRQETARECTPRRTDYTPPNMEAEKGPLTTLLSSIRPLLSFHVNKGSSLPETLGLPLPTPQARCRRYWWQWPLFVTPVTYS